MAEWHAPVLFFSLFAAGTLLYFFVPPFEHNGLVYNLLGLGTAAAIVAGARRHAPRAAAAWYLFAAAQVLFVLGDAYYYTYPKISHHPVPFPSLGDAFYLAVYPLIVAGLLRLTRARNPRGDRGGVIDALMVATGVGLLSWVFLMAPYAHRPELSSANRMVSIAYPLMDVLVLFMGARLAIAGGRRGLAFDLLMLGVLCLLVTDAMYGYITLNGTYATGSPLDLGWLAYYFSWGAAALHPSMRALSEPAPGPRPRFSGRRRALLTMAALTAPGVQVLQTVRHQPLELPVVLGGSILLLLLAMARMNGAVRQHEQAEVREHALREAGSAFLSATTPEATYRAAIEALVGVAGAGAESVIARGTTPDRLEVVARRSAAGTDAPLTERVVVGDELWRTLAVEGVAVLAPDPAVWSGLSVPAEHTWLALAPLVVRDSQAGLMAVSTAGEPGHRALDGIVALAGQTSLALDAILRSEDLYRARTEARFLSLVQNASDVVAVIDAGFAITFLSPSAERVFGYDPAALSGTNVLDLVHPDDRWTVADALRDVSQAGSDVLVSVESRWRLRNAGWAHTETLLTDLSADPNVRGIVLNIRDISERKAAEERLAHQAYHDPVTGLANRLLFHRRVDHALTGPLRRGTPLVVLFVDLDDFKTVNDSLGHAAGDRLLAGVAVRLHGAVRSADTVARLGGDEFAILMENAGAPDGVEVAERILAAFQAPFALGEKEVFVRASIGIAATGDGAVLTGGADAVLRDADVAMYLAKTLGKNRYQLFEATMREGAVRRLELGGELQRGIENGEFVLHYQPVIDLGEGRVAGLEALVRWNHPRRGLLGPAEFIPFAEESGLIVPLGEWVLDEACRMAKSLNDGPCRDRPLVMSINLSGRQLQDPAIVRHVEAALERSGLDVGHLLLEITETVMMHEVAAGTRAVAQLKALGVRLAIDDFGTGYSSLTSIREFPIDILKIDKSFVDRMTQSGEDAAVTATILELAAILKLSTVAEGIEHGYQLNQLIGLGCRYGQGFHFSRPLDAAAIAQFLSRSMADHPLLMSAA